MSDSAITAFLIVAKALIVLLGGLITVSAFRAFRRTGSTAMRSFTIGFGVVTLGGIVGGGLNHVLHVALRPALLLQSLLTAIGFGVLVSSLYLDDPLIGG
ncbi:MAG: hypothetical protein ABEJ08_05245 [Halobacteriaceae archaeon]